MEQNSPQQQIPWTAIATIFFLFLIFVVFFNFSAVNKLACARWIDNPNFKEEGCLLNYISEFQTLITGLAAVSAAFLTVKQMRETDQQAERLHHEQIELMMRPQYAAITKTCEQIGPILDGAQRSIDEFHELYKRMGSANFDLGELQFAHFSMITRLQQLLVRIEKIPPSTVDLFDALVDEDVGNLKTLIEACLVIVGDKEISPFVLAYSSENTLDDDYFREISAITLATRMWIEIARLSLETWKKNQRVLSL